MISNLLASFLTITFAFSPPRPSSVQAADSLELVRLEHVWNEAHVHADTAALASLWADDLVITVPGMPMMSKPEVMRFWRTGRSNITRYETSDLRVRVYGDAAVMTGRLRRERNFSGRMVADDWRFTKVYVRRQGCWRVVAYQASVAAQ
jgi:ketosteroid isomerase-like protein